MKSKPIFKSILILVFTLSAVLEVTTQTYQLAATGPPSIQTKAADVQLRFLPNNQIEYSISEGQWRGWSIAYEWGAPQLTYQPDGQILSISTKAWIINAGAPHRGATIGVTFRGLTNGDRLMNDGRAFAGFASSENQYVNGNNVAQIKMTQWDEPEIVATVYLTDDGGTTVTLASYSFRRTDASGFSSITLNTPEIKHNILNQGEYWMSITPTGWLSGLQGRKAQLVTRFYYSNETPLYAAPQELAAYRDVNGLVATATNAFEVNAPTINLDEQVMSIPYRALNLPNTGGQASYNLFLFVDVFIDGQLQKQSERVPFTVNW